MSNITNLNQFRKAKTKQDKEKKAEQNRVKFGQKKSEKSLNKAKRDLADKKLDAKKRDKQDD